MSAAVAGRSVFLLLPAVLLPLLLLLLRLPPVPLLLLPLPADVDDVLPHLPHDLRHDCIMYAGFAWHSPAAAPAKARGKTCEN